MKFKRAALTTLISLLPLTSSANLFPIGHEEALMANVGTALPASPGNPLFNPAGMAFFTTNRLNITVSGNALEQHHFQLTGLDEDSQQSSIRPLLANSIFPVGTGYLSIYVTNPVAIKMLQSRMDTVSGYNVHMRFSFDADVIQGGLAYANLINKNMGWGISLGADYSTQEQNIYTYIGTSSAVTTEYRHERKKYLQPTITPGFLWEISDSYKLGLSGTLKLPTVFAEGLFYGAETDSSTPTTVDESFVIYNPRISPSYKLSIGQLLKIYNQEFLLDVSYGSRIDSKDKAGASSSTSEYKDYGIAWRGSAFNKVKPLAGFAYTDQSTSESYLFTGGITIQDRANVFALGAYYQKNQPKVSNSSPYDGIGLMASSNVIY
ncbi:hypothetical protein [Bdellovibrio sp. HCB209]|uniref:hypothetical protein n=1 Tax=Bdellovibrio sp. HCB209 TaxID=3394354 RepID=UPI0039B3B7DF